MNSSAIANRLECKWDTVQRIISRCENIWGSVEGVPEDYSNEEIADMLFTAIKSVDLDYLQPDCEKILEKQRQGYLLNELWADCCAEAAKLGKKAYKLSRFNEIVSEYRSKRDISSTMNHMPGLEGQADWAGDHSESLHISQVLFHIQVLDSILQSHSQTFLSNGSITENLGSVLKSMIISPY